MDLFTKGKLIPALTLVIASSITISAAQATSPPVVPLPPPPTTEVSEPGILALLGVGLVVMIGRKKFTKT